MQRSENGKVLPFDSKEMTAMATYLQWISKDIPVYAEVPWLGVGTMQNYKEGDQEVGKTVYTSKCAACHGPDGQGTPAGPPVWGDKSYNDGAGMSKPQTLANFALLNMPRGNPTLTQEEAENVAAFVDSQPRPHFVKPSSP